jgi:hypothetical protein
VELALELQLFVLHLAQHQVVVAEWMQVFHTQNVLQRQSALVELAPVLLVPRNGHKRNKCLDM